MTQLPHEQNTHTHTHTHRGWRGANPNPTRTTLEICSAFHVLVRHLYQLESSNAREAPRRKDTETNGIKKSDNTYRSGTNSYWTPLTHVPGSPVHMYLSRKTRPLQKMSPRPRRGECELGTSALSPENKNSVSPARSPSPPFHH
ncbi:unnamed protein product, partial [Ectocarpus fasciculatus]